MLVYASLIFPYITIMKSTLEHPSEYSSWNQMKQRCYNKNNSSFKNYGERGIVVCDSWRYSFESFFLDMGKRPLNYTLERIDNSLGYSPENCKWATRLEQVQNRRNMHFIEYNGISLTLNGWAKYLGVTSATIYKRKGQNLPLDKLLAPRHPKYKNCFK